MICICGYANKSQNSWTHTEEEYEGKRIGEEEFIKISGEFNVHVSDGGIYSHLNRVSLYACPECKTIQLVD